jgi:hypothetical protein
MYQLSDEEAEFRNFGGGTTLCYFKEMGEHPAAEKPILIMQNEKDFQATDDASFHRTGCGILFSDFVIEKKQKLSIYFLP